MQGVLQNELFCSTPFEKTICEPDGARILHLYSCKTTLFLTLNASIFVLQQHLFFVFMA